MLARPRELLPVVALFLCACPEPRQPRPAADGPPRRSARPDVRSRGSRDARREPSKIAPPGPRTLALGEPPALPVPARKGGLPRPVPRGRAAIRALRPDGDTRLETLIALESPISGTVKPGASRRRRLSALPVTRFVPHQALDAHPVGAGWVAVLASTGLWLHEGRTLARRVLLVPPPVAAMDATRDGRKLAYARCTAGWRRRCRLEVVSFPGL